MVLLGLIYTKSGVVLIVVQQSRKTQLGEYHHLVFQLSSLIFCFQVQEWRHCRWSDPAGATGPRSCQRCTWGRQGEITESSAAQLTSFRKMFLTWFFFRSSWWRGTRSMPTLLSWATSCVGLQLTRPPVCPTSAACTLLILSPRSTGWRCSAPFLL